MLVFFSDPNNKKNSKKLYTKNSVVFTKLTLKIITNLENFIVFTEK